MVQKHITGLVGFVIGIAVCLVVRDHIGTYIPISSRNGWSSQEGKWMSGEGVTAPVVFDSVPSGKHGVMQYVADNERVLNELAHCKSRGNCTPNQEKVIIFVGYWCFAAVYEGYNGGEGVWCRSMLRAMRRLGYSSILHVRSGDDWEYAYNLHKAHGDDIHLIIGDQIEEAKPFYKTTARPDGIPAWKHLFFTYFPACWDNVIGNEWSVTGEKETARDPFNMTFIGFEVECDPSQYVPFEQRPPQALILSKKLSYFYLWNPAWDPTWFKRATEDLRRTFHPDFEFVATFDEVVTDDDLKLIGFEPEVPTGIRNLGLRSPAQYDRLVAESRVLVGIGSPGTSPSPYGALCKGTPFINPHRLESDRSPSDRYGWEDVQHGTIRFMDPPYVYQVERHNYTSFLQGLTEALTSSTPSFQFPDLRSEAVDVRVRSMLERDWYQLAKETLGRRLAGTEGDQQYDTTYEL